MFHSPGVCASTDPGEHSFKYHLIRATPIGDLAVIYRESPFIILRILLPKSLGLTGKRLSPDKACPESLRIAQTIIDYIQGDPAAPGQPPWHLFCLDHLSSLQLRVLQATADIPYGQTASYKKIAETIDRPGAYRFVGSALAKNPFPILIPCHRVIRSDGSSGEYGGGSDLKKWLINLESRQPA